MPIERYSFETIELMKDRAEIMKWRRELKVARLRLAGATEAEAEASVPKIILHAIDVSFDAIHDPEERALFMNLPTPLQANPPHNCCNYEELDRVAVVNSLLNLTQ